MRRVKLPKLKCLRCGWTWVPRIPVSAVCPKCHTPYWDTPKKDTPPQFLYHITRTSNLDSIGDIGLIPKKPVEWRKIIPSKYRNEDIIWLLGYPRKNNRWRSCLRIDVSTLNKFNLYRLHKLNAEKGTEWWFYVGNIPSNAISQDFKNE